MFLGSLLGLRDLEAVSANLLGVPIGSGERSLRLWRPARCVYGPGENSGMSLRSLQKTVGHRAASPAGLSKSPCHHRGREIAANHEVARVTKALGGRAPVSLVGTSHVLERFFVRYFLRRVLAAEVTVRLGAMKWSSNPSVPKNGRG
jgi:hypothetical protein